MRQPRRTRPAFSVLDLCAGAGGQALGFENAGFRHVGLIDNDSHACATLRTNRPYWNTLEADIRDVKGSLWHHTDVVAGGLPCPPFSIAGLQRGRDDERDLFPALLRLIGDIKPQAVMVENVAGIMEPRFGKYRAHICKQLDDLHYATDWQTLNALDFGTPQNRVRSFLIALYTPNVDIERFVWPEPRRRRGVTVGEALIDLMGEGGWALADEWAEQADQPAPTLVGGSKKHGGPDLGPTRARTAWARLGVDGKGIADAPPTPGFNGMPRLTNRMAARLQSFPLDWSFCGRKTNRYRQIGNALPVDLSYAMASALANVLSDSAAAAATRRLAACRT